MRKSSFLYSLLFVLATYVASAQVVGVVEYMKTPEYGGDNYEAVEKQLLLPMHQKLVNDKKILYWALFKIPFPGGESAEYNYATVRMYANLEAAGYENNLSDLFKAVHPSKDFNVEGKKTLDSRDMVKSARMSQWGQFFGDNNVRSKVLTVVYIKVKDGKTAEYKNVEKTMWEPMHKMEIANGKRQGWQGWQQDMPWGSSQPYNFIAVDFYKDWAQYTKVLPEADYLKATKGKTFTQIIAATNEVESVYRTEEWHLVAETGPPQ